jgi:hypothetical protein
MVDAGLPFIVFGEVGFQIGLPVEFQLAANHLVVKVRGAQELPGFQTGLLYGNLT